MIAGRCSLVHESFHMIRLNDLRHFVSSYCLDVLHSFSDMEGLRTNSFAVFQLQTQHCWVTLHSFWLRCAHCSAVALGTCLPFQCLNAGTHPLSMHCSMKWEDFAFLKQGLRLYWSLVQSWTFQSWTRFMAEVVQWHQTWSRTCKNNSMWRHRRSFGLFLHKWGGLDFQSTIFECSSRMSKFQLHWLSYRLADMLVQNLNVFSWNWKQNPKSNLYLTYPFSDVHGHLQQFDVSSLYDLEQVCCHFEIDFLCFCLYNSVKQK